jgi:carboxylesterase
MAETPSRNFPTAPLALPPSPEKTGGVAIGVLFVHGFTGSPASMKPWARALAERGYGVEVPLLPGHGTRWQDLNKVSWADWYAEADAAFERLRQSCDRVVVAGLSMGGCLALRLAEERQDAISGILLVNPFLSSIRTELALLPVLKYAVPSLRGVVNDIKKPGQDEHGYSRLPLKGLAEVLAMWKVVVPALSSVTQPVLYFHSRTDHVIDPSSAATVLNGIASTDVEERPLENSYHVATLDNDAERIFTESAEFVARVTKS